MNNPYQNINTATPTDRSRTGIVQVLLITAPGFEEECWQLQSVLGVFEQKYPFTLSVLNIGQDKFLRQAYQGKLPCLEIGPFTLSGTINSNTLENALYEAQFRLAASQVLKTQKSRKSASKPPRFTIGIVFPYGFLSITFPLSSSSLLFSLVFFSCAYPHEIRSASSCAKHLQGLSHLLSPISFSVHFSLRPTSCLSSTISRCKRVNLFWASHWVERNQFCYSSAFIGNPNIGYKLALCQRDLAIQSAILIFTLLFALSHQKIKPVPILIWAVLGFLPIILDGSTQLLSQFRLASFSLAACS